MSSIREIGANPVYRESTRKAAEILAFSQPVGDLISHRLELVVRFGNEHLISSSNNMPLYQFLMFDIFLAITAAVVAVTVLIIYIIHHIMRLISTLK